MSQNLPTHLPAPILSAELLKAIEQLKIEYSTDGADRLIRAHGHTMREIFLLKHGSFERIPDIVIWPNKSCNAEKDLFIDLNSLTLGGVIKVRTKSPRIF
ncbi:Alkyldihydroxyacetonephosphate synthase, peroxisomal [Harpegnathos saltator]|uniref:Alkylglycerone-phosphate synthase n=1 Tax=Harpegnathos saltator TaxID=610380 RepID=E2BIB0_HARSA|nr:Alkyldihydroxyacetonephosphate synthase, peroxisomal [Harpegnathos saltator]